MKPLEWKKDKIAANGISIAVEQAGPERGEPALLVMGLGCQLIQWPEELCADLVARGFRVTRFDNRDIGLSGDGNRGIRIDVRRDFLRTHLGLKPGPSNYTLHDLSADAVGVLDALGIPAAHFIGVSMGGMISQITAARHADRVKSLVSIMSGTNRPWSRQTRMDLMIRMTTPLPDHQRETVVKRSAETMRLIGSPKWPTALPERLAFAGRNFDRAFRPGGVLRQMHGIVATGSIEAWLPNVKAPTQIIHGTDDPLVRPVCGQRSAQCIRGAKLELIEGMGHDCPVPLMPRWAELIAANAARA